MENEKPKIIAYFPPLGEGRTGATGKKEKWPPVPYVPKWLKREKK